MRRSRQALLVIAIAAVVLSQSRLAARAESRANRSGRIVIVVAKHSKIRNLSLDELRRVFLRESNWIDSVKVIPLNQPTRSTTRQLFDSIVLKMSPAVAERHWIDRRIRTGEGAPQEVATRKLQMLTSRFSTVIGYVDAADLRSHVRPITIEGKSYTDPDYPLIAHVP
jgi:hypothetical protein